MNWKIFYQFLTILVLSSACASSNTVLPPQATAETTPETSTTLLTATITAAISSATLTKTSSPFPVETLVPSQRTETPRSTSIQHTESPTPQPTLDPKNWQDLPVIPKPSNTVIAIYERGLELGNNANAFSKVGDCGSTPAWFLGDFDRGEEFYSLGEFDYLKAVILAYHGSFERTSLAARSGFTASSLLTTLWTNLEYCQVTETPLVCEYRIHKPVVAFITLGTNDIWLPEQFEPQMRTIIEYSMDQGVIPILATKADNAEGDGSINATIARLASEYDIPLWNYWLAVQLLPDHGLQEDQSHLTWGRNFFDKPENLTKAWPVRNLTALQVLNEVWKKISGQSG